MDFQYQSHIRTVIYTFPILRWNTRLILRIYPTHSIPDMRPTGYSQVCSNHNYLALAIRDAVKVSMGQK